MAIETLCPHCKKSYRLRDDLAGKRVTCGNPDCRKAFTVEAGANGSAARPAGARPAAKPPAARPAAPAVDAEALAAATFAEDAGTAAPVDQRTIALTCSACDHKWDVPWAMQGKNVLCPECRHRQRVPEQKTGKVDWRDPNAGGPSLRKIEKLEGVEATIDARMVSGETLRKTGVIEENIEPRPRWHYAAVGVLGLLLVGGVAFGIFSYFSSRQEGKQDQYMAEAVQEMAEAQDVQLPANEIPLFRAALQIRAGEYALRQDRPQEAVNHLASARQELLAAQPSAGRDLLFGELALTQAMLGGSDEQVNELQSRILWVPPPARDARGRSEGRVDTVLSELTETFRAMRKKEIALDVRIHVMRRLTRDLAARGQPDLTARALPEAFEGTEQTQGRAEVAAEALKATGQQEKARKEVGELSLSLQGPADAGLSTVVALAQAIDPPVQLGSTIAPPSASGDVGDGPRLAYTTLYLLQNKPGEALDLAKRPGPLPGRLRALALVAEWSDPGPAVQAAAEAVATHKKGDAPLNDLVLMRLAREAGRANQPEKVETFVRAIAKEDMRAWAKAEGLRAQLAAGSEGQVVDYNLAPVPDNLKDHRIGHGWARLAVVRHNARASGDDRAVLIEVNSWSPGSYRPLGKAGLALGLQDRAVR